MNKARYIIDGQVVPNLLTSVAKREVLRFLARLQSDWAGAISVGTGTTAATTGDTTLNFEYYRAPVSVRSVDLTNDEVVIKATLPTNLIGKVYEIGVYSLATTGPWQAGFLITDFDTSLSSISNVSANSDNSRVGNAAAQVSVPASTTVTASLTGITRNFSESDYSDMFKIAFEALDANVSSLEVRLVNASGDYFTYTISSPTAGYGVESWTRLDMTNSGSMSWGDDVVQIDFLVSATGTDAEFVLDGLRLTGAGEDTEAVLISRAVLGSPVIKEGIEEMDIEYRIQFSL